MNTNDDRDAVTLADLPDVVLAQIFFGGYLSVPEILPCTILNNKFFDAWFRPQQKDDDEDDDDKLKSVKDLFWKKYMDDELLPGETVDDLRQHLDDWEEYREALRKGIIMNILNYEDGKEGDGASAVAFREKFQRLLLYAIGEYTLRVAAHHSWYKRLPTAGGLAGFEMFLSLTSGMRRLPNNEWVDYLKNDGNSSFHYTWTTTEKYRKKFGYFDFRQVALTDKWGTYLGVEKLHEQPTSVDFQGRQVFIPKSARVIAPVTSAVHNLSRPIDYEVALQHAIDNFNSCCLEEPLLIDWSIRHHVQGGEFPEEAAADVRAIAEACIIGQEEEERLWHTRFQRFTDKGTSPKPSSVSDWAKVVILAQQTREYIAIARASLACCLEVFGEDLCPSVDKVEVYVTPTRRRGWRRT